MNEKKKERKKERKRYMRKREKNMSMCQNKNKSELPSSLKCIRNFKASRLKKSILTFQPCAIR
jgi:hypothetical protein